jgi:hypothetical protein
MSPHYSRWNGEYVYNVTVTENTSARPSRRYRAHLSRVESVKAGGPVEEKPHIADTYGPTAKDAVRSIDARLETWRRERRPPED